MNHQQILENMLSFSLQQHQIKDKLVEDLQKQLTDLRKQQEAQAEVSKPEVKKAVKVNSPN